LILLTESPPEIKTLVLVEMTRLIGHEEIMEDYLEKLKNIIEYDGVLKKPIVVDKSTNIIIDGHHRLEALKRLGCSRIPVYFVNYKSRVIKIETWNGSEPVTKDMVIKTALNGGRFPPKTTRHMIKASNNWVHISHIQKDINIPLRKLI